jgi:hypothetical protein
MIIFRTEAHLTAMNTISAGNVVFLHLPKIFMTSAVDKGIDVQYL